MAVLRARLLDHEQQKHFEIMDKERRMQVGSGQRAEKIRTYNFPQNRVTDHRVGFTLYRLPDVLDGDLDPFFEELTVQWQAEQLETMADGEV